MQYINRQKSKLGFLLYNKCASWHISKNFVIDISNYFQIRFVNRYCGSKKSTLHELGILPLFTHVLQ